ncbi:type II toxin-antitoxin system prevent-host-death family antitoxin [Yinghuangia aomiensis]|uniref:type II toxin-antitoxin system prevent-host-death family antitoxin n=1 Tax=Yinghuangia aomiensis TaxID=676205 RepID=UPI0031EBF7A1
MPKLLDAATQGTTTSIATGPHHAWLTSPKAAAALGWDLTTAPAYGVADARKHLGRLVQDAAAGRPQVVSRHSHPVAVLLPATAVPATAVPADGRAVPGTGPAGQGPAGQGPAALPGSAAPVPAPAAAPPAPGPAAAPGPVPATAPAAAPAPIPDVPAPAASGAPTAPAAPGVPAVAPAVSEAAAAAASARTAPAAASGSTQGLAAGLAGTLAPVAPTPAAPVPAAAVPAAPAPAATPVPPAAAAPAPAATPAPVAAVPGPATLHEARATLPRLVKNAAAGIPTRLSSGGDHAVLTAPAAAAALGWNVAAARVYSIVEGRLHLGDLVRAAAQGRPQVLRRHSTPVAVLLPTTTGAPGTPATGTPTAPGTAAVPAPGAPAPHPATTPPATAPAPAATPTAGAPGTATASAPTAGPAPAPASATASRPAAPEPAPTPGTVPPVPSPAAAPAAMPGPAAPTPTTAPAAAPGVPAAASGPAGATAPAAAPTAPAAAAAPGPVTALTAAAAPAAGLGVPAAAPGPAVPAAAAVPVPAPPAGSAPGGTVPPTPESAPPAAPAPDAAPPASAAAPAIPARPAEPTTAPPTPTAATPATDEGASITPLPAPTTAPAPAPASAAPGPAVPAAAPPAPAAVPGSDLAVTPSTAPAAPAQTAPDPAAPTAAAPAVPRSRRSLAVFADVLDTVLAPPAPDNADGTDAETPAAGAALGIRVLDDLLGPLQPGRLYLVAAAPGTGGSLLATAAARTTALDRDLPVLYAASGLTAADVTARIVAAHLPVDYRRLRASRLTPAEQDDVRTLYGELAAAPLYLDDGAGLTAADVAQSAAGVEGLALVVVDRLQTARDTRLPLSGPAQVTDAVQELAHLARTRRVPVLAVLDSPAAVGPDAAAAGDAADVRVLLTADGSWVHATVAERDLGVLGDTVLHADLAHARLQNPPARPAPGSLPPTPPGAAPGPAAHGHVPNLPATPGPSPAPPASATSTTAPGQAAVVPGEWPEVTRPGTALHPAAGPAPSTATPAPAAVGQHAADTPARAPEQPSEPAEPSAAPRTTTKPHQGVQAPSTPAQAPGQAPAAPHTTAAPGRRTAVPVGEGRYGGRDYSDHTAVITRAVDRALAEHDGDVEAASAALEKRAIPDVMALFDSCRVGSRYEHTVYPELPEILRKKTRAGVDEVWEGRHKWSNAVLLGELEAGRAPVTVDVLDTNAAFLSAWKAHLPIGKLVHDPNGGFDRRRSGMYLLKSRPRWAHPQLPDPIGNRRETGPVILGDPTVRLLIRCAEQGLCEAPAIAENWTSGASEDLLEKLRRVLTLAREDAIENGDTVAEAYIKSMYAKFTSTIGESSSNRDLRRPEWMHIIRSQAFANLWRKGHKAYQAGLTLVQLRGTDELHVTGGDWREIFPEGRNVTQTKTKDRYTLPRTSEEEAAGIEAGAEAEEGGR